MDTVMRFENNTKKLKPKIKPKSQIQFIKLRDSNSVILNYKSCWSGSYESVEILGIRLLPKFFKGTFLKYYVFNIFTCKTSVIIWSFIRVKTTLTCSENPGEFLIFIASDAQVLYYKKSFKYISPTFICHF